MRRFCLKDRRLIEAALEASELALDKAEAQVFRALRTGQLSNRLQAAAFIVKSRGRSRYSPADASEAIPDDAAHR